MEGDDHNGDRPEPSNTTPPIPPPTQQIPHTVSSIKLRILKKGEYDTWAMKMEDYLCHTDYPIWQVIQNGNGLVSVITNTHRMIKVLPPKTAKEVVARERERKARTTLLMALPEDHLAKFHLMADAKEMREAIKSRFSGNDESKKMQKYLLKQQFKGFFVSSSEGLHKGYDRFQTLLSQLEILGAGVSKEDANQKFLRSLPSSWSQVSLFMRTKSGLDTLSFDDLYNNLKLFKRDVKGRTASSKTTQNMAFVSGKSTSSTNNVSTAYSVSSPSVSKSQQKGSSSYTDEVIHSFFANQSSAPKLDYDDLEQINDYDIEEIDLKCQVAMISMRIKKFHKRTGRKLLFDTKDPISFDKTKVECFNCHKMGHFSRECRAKGNQDRRRRDVGYNENKARDNSRCLAYQEDLNDLVTVDEENIDWSGHVEEDAKNYAMMAYSNLGSDNESVFINKESDLEDTLVNDIYADETHAVPPPKIGNYMTSGPDVDIDYSKFTYGPKQPSADESDSKPSEYASCKFDSGVEPSPSVPEPVKNESQVVYEPKVWTDVPIIEEYESDSDDDSVSNVQEQKEKPSFAFTNSVKHGNTSSENIKEKGTPNHSPKIEKQDSHRHTKKGLGYAFTQKACFICGSFSHIIRDCDFHEKRMAKHAKLTINKNKEDLNALVTVDGEDIDWSGHVEEDAKNYAMMAYSNLGSDNEESDLEDTPMNDRYDDGMRAVLPPMTGNYMPSGPHVDIDYSKFTYGPKQPSAHESDSKPSKYASCKSDSSVEPSPSGPEPVENKSQVVCEPKVWTDAYIIEEYESDSHDDSVSNVQEEKEKPSFAFTKSVMHDDLHKALKDKGIVDSGCSTHMTRNKAHLADYKNLTVALLPFEVAMEGLLSSEDKIEKNEKPVSQVEQVFLEELEKLKRQEKEANDAYPLSIVGTSRAFTDCALSYPDPFKIATQDDPTMPHLEDIYASPSEEIFTNSSYDADGVVTNFNYLKTTVNVSPTATTRIHTIHPKTQILGDPNSAYQTRRKVNKNYKAHALKVWILADFPFGKKAIRTEWVYRNKKDEREKSWCVKFKELMKNRFQMSFMGELTFFLRLQVKQKEDGIFISQDKYVAEILKSLFFLSVKTASIPIKTRKPLVKDEEATDVDVYLYRKSTTGFCQFLGRRLILWQCKKQTIVATSITEADYVAAAHYRVNTPRCDEDSLELKELMVFFIPICVEKDRVGVNAGFEQIIDFLNGSSVRYALTSSPIIRTSCIKQFWSTAKVKTVNDEVRVHALIDAKRVNIKESSIRCTLKLDDEEGTSCLANDEIFTGLANMGYEKISDKLTFYKAFFSPSGSS
nr:hypothetical protein [Tanacetum cinerariifolium]